MNKILPFSAYLAGLLQIATIVICLMISPDFNGIDNPSVSSFGLIPETELVFASGLILSSMFGFLFLIYLKQKRFSNFTLGFGFVTLIHLVALTIFPYDLHPGLHNYSAYTFFAFYSLFILFLSLHFKIIRQTFITLGIAYVFLLITYLVQSLFFWGELSVGLVLIAWTMRVNFLISYKS